MPFFVSQLEAVRSICLSMESQGIYSGHLLVLAFHVWGKWNQVVLAACFKSSSAAGHLRPLCAFSAKVVQERPDLAITFLIVGDWRKCVEREISRCFSDRKPDFGTAGSIRWFVSPHVFREKPSEIYLSVELSTLEMAHIPIQWPYSLRFFKHSQAFTTTSETLNLSSVLKRRRYLTQYENRIPYLSM